MSDLELFVNEDRLPASFENVIGLKAISVYESETGLQPYIDHVQAEVKKATESMSLDMSKPADRKKLRSIAAKVSKSKTAIEGPGREFLKERKASIKPIESNLKNFKDSLDAIRDEVKAPADEYEAEEERQRQAKQDAVDLFNAKTTELGSLLSGIPLNDRAERIKELIESLNDFDVSIAQERQAEAEGERAKAVMTLNGWLAYAEKEVEQAKAQRAAEDEAIRKQAAEDATKAQEAALRKAELDRKQAEESARIERENADKRAEQAAKEAREAAQREAQELQAQQEAEQKARAENKEHKRAVNTAILGKLVGLGVDNEMAKKIITAAAKGELGNMTVNY